MNQETKHVMVGYFDLFLTMGPEESGRWIEQIDALDHCDKCRFLEEFEWAKERYPNYRRANQYSLPREVRQQLYDLLERYWEQRRRYGGGYYYRYFPEPWPEETPRRYAMRVGIGMSMLIHQFVLQYQKEPFMDLRFALAMRLPQERDRVCLLIESMSVREADRIREEWPKVVDLWMLKLSSHPPVALDSLETVRQAFDNFVYKQVMEELA